MGINGAVDEYRRSKGLGQDDETALRHGLAHGIGSGVSGMLSFHIAPHFLGKLFDKGTKSLLKSGMAVGLEGTGWDIGTQMIEKMTMDGLEGRDVSIADAAQEIDPTVAAAMFGGSFLLGVGGGLLVKGFRRGSKAIEYRKRLKNSEKMSKEYAVHGAPKNVESQMRVNERLDDYLISPEAAEPLNGQGLNNMITDVNSYLKERELIRTADNIENAVVDILKEHYEAGRKNFISEDNIIRIINGVM